MDDKIYTITLADGTVLENLRLNGNNFISETEVDSDVFDGNCSTVVINDGTTDTTYTNMELIQVTTPVSGEWWFILNEISESRLAFMRMESDIEYVAMMAGIEL